MTKPKTINGAKSNTAKALQLRLRVKSHPRIHNNGRRG